jgi:hypothetical protein
MITHTYLHTIWKYVAYWVKKMLLKVVKCHLNVTLVLI